MHSWGHVCRQLLWWCTIDDVIHPSIYNQNIQPINQRVALWGCMSFLYYSFAGGGSIVFVLVSAGGSSLSLSPSVLLQHAIFWVAYWLDCVEFLMLRDYGSSSGDCFFPEFNPLREDSFWLFMGIHLHLWFSFPLQKGALSYRKRHHGFRETDSNGGGEHSAHVIAKWVVFALVVVLSCFWWFFWCKYCVLFCS